MNNLQTHFLNSDYGLHRNRWQIPERLFLRYKEQYVWWIITDIIAVAMYVVHFDPVYLTKKSIYLIMAVIGLYNWAKLQKMRNKNNE